MLCSEAFKLWEKSNDPAEQRGRGVAQTSVRSFMTWLTENDDDDSEDNDDDEDEEDSAAAATTTTTTSEGQGQAETNEP